jgi:general stress protein CsbA
MKRLYRFLLGLLSGGILWIVLLVISQIVLLLFHREIYQVSTYYWIFLCLISLTAGFLITYALVPPPKDTSVIAVHEEDAA